MGVCVYVCECVCVCVCVCVRERERDQLFMFSLLSTLRVGSQPLPQAQNYHYRIPAQGH